MTNKLERLRELVRRADSSEHYWQQQASAMEFAAHGDWLLDRLEKLEAAVEVAKYFLDERELLMDEYYSVRGDDEQFKLFQEKEKQWRDALAAVEEKG